MQKVTERTTWLVLMQLSFFVLFIHIAISITNLNNIYNFLFLQNNNDMCTKCRTKDSTPILLEIKLKLISGKKISLEDDFLFLVFCARFYTIFDTSIIVLIF